LEKLKQFCLSGKPKQAKHAIHLIFNNFEKPKNEEILYELFKELQAEALLKKAATFVTCLISLGHICLLMPQRVGKEIKEFMSKSIVKEVLMVPCITPGAVNSSTTDISQSDELSSSAASLSSAKRKNSLKLAGKWCENEDELPFSTRARIEALKLVIRWCLGLKSECNNIIYVLRILIKLMKENSSSELSSATLDSLAPQSNVTEAEKARIRSVCGSQIIKLAQEGSFKPLITAEYFHLLARLIIDPVTDVRDIIVIKLNRGLKRLKLPIYYMSLFALCGLDVSRERKARVKKIYSQLIKSIRLNNSSSSVKDSNKTRIVPEMCLSYAVSLLAHNIKIDSLKDDHKLKQIKECMNIILDPLLEHPDAYQIAYIKKILNKIKESDDGLTAVVAATAATAAAAAAANNSTDNLKSYHNLFQMNKNLCYICEIFLFHMHSKSTNYLAPKDYQFEVKLPSGFFTLRADSDVDSDLKQKHQQQIDREIQEGFKKLNKEDETAALVDQDDLNEMSSEQEVPKKPAKKQKSLNENASGSRKRKISSELHESYVVHANKKSPPAAAAESDSEEDNVSLSELKKKRQSNESKNSSLNSFSNTSDEKRNRKSEPEEEEEEEEKIIEKKSIIVADEEKSQASKKSTRSTAKTGASSTKKNSQKKEEKSSEDEEEEVKETPAAAAVVEAVAAATAARKTGRNAKAADETKKSTAKSVKKPSEPINTSISTRPRRAASLAKK
jgi:sister-chromatid-cohesion protein PDS5